MHRQLITFLAFFAIAVALQAQSNSNDGSATFDNKGNMQTNNVNEDEQQNYSKWGRDTTQTDKIVPHEVRQWKIDDKFGNRFAADVDTLPHLFNNDNATDGLHGEYNILGNLGSPRMARNFFDREAIGDFMFIQQFDFFHTTPQSIVFTNTKSPYTNLTYHSCGGKENGQDRIRAYFATNVNKIAGFGFKLDYAYGRGYYNNQANSQFGGTIFGYYLGERYDIHAFFSWEHFKMAENGGIENDLYITNPQSFSQRYDSKNIPTNLSSVWNRNDHQTYFFTHRYHLGKYVDIEIPDSLKPVMPSASELFESIKSDSLKEVLRADTLRYRLAIDSLQKRWQAAQITPQDFIPITSIFHTFNIRYLDHRNTNEGNPTGYFINQPYYRSTYNQHFEDKSTTFSMKNTLGVQLREGFNKWMKAGISLFAAHELKDFRLPGVETTDSTNVFNKYLENHVSVGGDIRKTMGHTIHYDAGAEFWVVGPNIGDLDVHGGFDLNFRLGKDTLRFDARGSFKLREAGFYLRHFHSMSSLWDQSFNKETRTRVEATLAYDYTRTKLRFGFENISDYTYLYAITTPVTSGTTTTYKHDVGVKQNPGSVQVMSAALVQNFKWGIFHWDNDITWQYSSNNDVLPLPALSIFTNPYIKFRIAKILKMEIGVDMRYFTSYYGYDYAPFVNQFVVQDPTQERVKIGNYPVLNGYINIAIKGFRAYVAVKHFNAGTGNYFWAPHYPMDPLNIHFGISWNFYN